MTHPVSEFKKRQWFVYVNRTPETDRHIEFKNGKHREQEEGDNQKKGWMDGEESCMTMDS
jgi:hypothetical protein